MRRCKEKSGGQGLGVGRLLAIGISGRQLRQFGTLVPLASLRNQRPKLNLHHPRRLQTPIVVLHHRPFNLHHLVVLLAEVISLVAEGVAVLRLVQYRVLYFILLVPFHHLPLLLLF